MSRDIDALFEKLLERPEAEREQAIAELSAGDAQTADELRALLSSYSEATGFFDRLARDVGLPHPAEPAPMSSPSSDPNALIGQHVAQYQVSAFLGGGGMGAVYKAKDSRLGRTVALKFLPAAGHDAEAKERFLREARAASALDHPNICTVFEIGEDRGHAFIAMAFYEGPTLESMVSRGPVDVDAAMTIGLEMCSALAAAHSKGIVHRDIKPANVIVADGVTKILDFGLAKSEDAAAMTQEGMVLGTAAYMSPEQATGKPVDHRSDVWSTGAVLYELLSGSRPFPGAYPQAILYNILNTDPEPLAALRPGLPLQLVDVFERALRKNPDDRFNSMHDMADALKAVSDRQHAKSEARQFLAPSEEVHTPAAIDDSDDDILHILCVDDEPELELLMQQRFRKKLRAGEWKFTFALDGMDALTKLEANPDIGVILTDLNMPRMDGLTLLEKLAELDRPLRTVVVSAYGDMDKIRTAMNRGAFDFVTKPVDFKDLETTTLKAAADLAEYKRALRGQQQAISIQQEMDVARRIQDAIIPVSFPSANGLEMYGFSAPAADVSGTFYDAFDLPDGRIGLLMGDVGGRGVTAALLMAMGQTFVKSFMQRGVSPGECLGQLNAMLFADGLPHVGLQMIAAIVDPASGETTISNAGHESAYVLRAGQTIDPVAADGSAVWDTADEAFQEQTVGLDTGDALVMVSRGMTGATNPNGMPFSSDRLAGILRSSEDTRPTSLIRSLVRSVQDHVGDADPREDLTVLALRKG